MALILSEALRNDVYQTKLQLAEKMACTPREVELLVERARKAGALAVMSGPDGYRLARNPEEYAYNVKRREARALGQLATVHGEKEYLERWRRRVNPPTTVQESLW